MKFETKLKIAQSVTIGGMIIAIISMIILLILILQ